MLAEHRLERCLPAADRVIAMDRGRITCDAPPREFLEWAAAHAPALQTPAAELFARAGLRPPPTGVKEARATLRAHGLPRAGRPRRRPGERRRAARAPAALAGPPRRPAGPGARVRARLARAPRRAHDPSRRRLRARAGERVALMGRNGAGKSTLLRHAERPARAEPRRGQGGRARRAPAPEPRRLLPPRPGRRRGARRRGRARRARPSRGAPPARPLRRRAPAARARGRPRRP